MSSIQIADDEELAVRKDAETGFGLGGGHLLRFGAGVASGCLLFAISRKLTWGLDEPMLDWRLGLLAIAPYLLYFGVAIFFPGPQRFLVSIQSTRLSAIWTVSLALYVAMHVTSLSRLIEDPIYDSLSLNLGSFLLLTLFYVTASLSLLWAVAAFRQRRRVRSEGYPGGNLKDAHLYVARLNTMFFGYLLSVPLFLLFVFYIPLQS